MTQQALDLQRAFAENEIKCKNTKSDDAISGCGELIASGRISGERLAVAHYNRGLRWFDRKQYDRAITDFDEALHINPRAANALNMRGLSYYGQNLLDRAQADFVRFIAIEPTNWLAHNNAAWIRMKRGDIEIALREANRAVELNDKSAIAHSTRGEIRRLKGDRDSALSELSYSIALDPSLLSAYVSRGQLYETRGEDEKALADYHHALTLSAQGIDGAAAVALVRQRIPDVESSLRNPLIVFLNRIGLTRAYWPIAGAAVIALMLAGLAFGFRRRIAPAFAWQFGTAANSGGLGLYASRGTMPRLAITDTGETMLYLGLHALLLLWSFLGYPKLIAFLSQSSHIASGQRLTLFLIHFVLTNLLVMMAFFSLRKYVSPQRRGFTTTEVALFVVTHGLQLIWLFFVRPAIFLWVLKAGYYGGLLKYFPVANSIVVTLMVFGLFLLGRQLQWERMWQGAVARGMLSVQPQILSRASRANRQMASEDDALHGSAVAPPPTPAPQPTIQEVAASPPPPIQEKPMIEPPPPPPPPSNHVQVSSSVAPAAPSISINPGTGGGTKFIAVIVNLFLPGVGTLIVGKIGQGIAQIVLYILGIFMIFSILLAFLGWLICVIVWIWALIAAATGKSGSIEVRPAPPQ